MDSNIWLDMYKEEIQIEDKEAELAGSSPNQRLVRVFKPVSKLFITCEGKKLWLYKFVDAIMVK